MKEQKLAIYILKLIAVIFITNSHYIPLYENVNTALATLGVHGNALFFFVSGYTITLSSTINRPFKEWYKHRIRRIWPTFIIWSLIISLVLKNTITWENILLAKGYWFIQCIMIYYAILYYIIHNNKKHIKLYFVLSIVITTITLFLMNKTKGSIFHSDLHWICYFPSMLLGTIIGIYNKEHYIKYNKIKLIFSFILYFLIMKIGKGRTDLLYYSQIVAILPLNLFIYYLYIYTSKCNLEKILNKRWIWNPIYWIASLSLEIYVVQFSIITNKFNFLFPLNTIIVFINIFIVAYILRICTNLFNQTFSDKSYSIKDALKI